MRFLPVHFGHFSKKSEKPYQKNVIDIRDPPFTRVFWVALSDAEEIFLSPSLFWPVGWASKRVVKQKNAEIEVYRLVLIQSQSKTIL